MLLLPPYVLFALGTSLVNALPNPELQRYHAAAIPRPGGSAENDSDSEKRAA